MPKGPTGIKPPACKHCGKAACYCCPDCGGDVWEGEHKAGCPSLVEMKAVVDSALKPAPKQNRTPCKACTGTGRASNNKQCYPCAGTGREGDWNDYMRGVK